MVDKKMIVNKNFEERYHKLNNKQKEAVDTVDGPVLVVAGPGSGKTELLAIRTANILKTTDILPNNILLLTFTDAGSFNMRDRLISLIGEEGYRVAIYTFHSFAGDIINKYPEYFFEGAKFKPATEIDQLSIVENILKNLPRKNILSSFHPELGYVYIRDVISSIRDLKKGNYTPETLEKKLAQNKKELAKLGNVLNDLEDISGKRKYSEVLPAYLKIYEKIKKTTEMNISKVLISTLELAIKKASEEESSKPLTAWKNSYTQKTESGKFILKDADPERQDKLESLLAVFTIYQYELYKNALYDFEDMILLVVKALQENKNLRADLQEKFQYIMVDEFQDTNDSQFQLVLELSKNSEDQVSSSTNILAVGDDDQAIFKFQGAELNNIYTFINNYKNTKVVVLDKNYRSTQEILNYARNVILKAEDRLEVRDKNITKEIKAENKKYLVENTGTIKVEKFDSETLEFDFICKELKNLLDKKIDPKEIAVICRKHGQLQKLSKVLNNFKIPYSYIKRENVLEKKHIKELITILKFLHLQKDGLGEEFLPEILSFDFWEIERIKIWQIAESVRKGVEEEDTNTDNKKVWRRISWLEAMHNIGDEKVRNIANFLIDLSVKSVSTPLEYVLDEIIGTTEFLWEDSEHDDTLQPRPSPAKSFVSPYKKFYFNNEIFDHNKTQYLEFLTSLRTFIGSLREFKSDQVLYVSDIFDFVQIYSGSNLTLSMVSPFASSENAVSLLTAHGSKGLEFEYVFLLSADSETWERGGRSSRIQFPVNMPLSPESENDDDKIRLLYVALTRAKHTLYITHNSQKVSYLSSEKESKQKDLKEDNKVSNKTLHSLELLPTQSYLTDEKILLKRLLENYKMPVTHLNNFLNFTRVGPEKFVEQNILRFPQAMTPSSAYGSAMHDAVERYFLYYKKFLKVPEKQYIRDSFKNFLERSRLPEIDFKKYLQSGYENLDIYFDYLGERKILPDTKVETKFNNENVTLDSTCMLTGNIDRLEFVGNNEIVVTDLKTGVSYESFEETGLAEYEKIKLHFYKYQLAFYSLLLENSKSYYNYKIKVGNLEFLEANSKGEIVILPHVIDTELKERVKTLACIVYKKIVNLDFPNTDIYTQNMKGILQFEEDLLSGKV